MYVRGYLQGSENGRVVTIGAQGLATALPVTKLGASSCAGAQNDNMN